MLVQSIAILLFPYLSSLCQFLYNLLQITDCSKILFCLYCLRQFSIHKYNEKTLLYNILTKG